jgi:hypothetical protein
VLLPVEAVAVVEFAITPEFWLVMVIELEFMSANASGAATANAPIAVTAAVATAADFRSKVIFIRVYLSFVLIPFNIFWRVLFQETQPMVHRPYERTEAKNAASVVN